MDGNVVDSVLHRLRGKTNTKNRQTCHSSGDVTGTHSGGVGEGGNSIRIDDNKNSGSDEQQQNTGASLLGLGRSLVVPHPAGTEEETPVTHIVRFVVTKLSWRGLYRRIMVISRITESKQENQRQGLWLETYHPDTGVRTNAWSIVGGDSSNDVVGVAVGGDHPHEGGMFVVTLRSGSGTKEAKFACHERAGLLDALYTAMHGVGSHHAMSSDMVFPAVKFSRSRREYSISKHVFLHIRDTGVYQVDEKNNTVSSWRWRFVRAGRPGVRLLGRGGGGITNDGAQQVCPPGYHALALCSHEGQSHMRVFAVKRRDVFCQTLCEVAKARVGVVVEVDASTASVAPEDMLSGLAAAEKETIDGILSGVSVSEWNVLKIKMNVDDRTVKKTIGRRCMVTKTHVVERRVDHYDVGSYRSLSSIACLIRYSHDAQLLGIEWGDGSPRDVYISSERDAFLTCLLYAGQLAAQRPLEVLPQPLESGDPLVRIHFHPVGSPALFYDAITESISLRQVLDASTAFIQASCHLLSMNALSVAVWSDVDGDVNVDAVRKLYRRLVEFNASVPYSGIEKDVGVDHHIVDAVFAFLPRAAASGGGALTMQEERVVITALHALQRLCCSHSAKAYILGLGGSFRRIFQCLECDNDHVSMEAARWMLRLFMGTSNPHVLCHPAWSKDVNDGVSPMERHEIMLASRMAKSVAFLSDERCSTVVGVLKGRTIVSALLGGVIVELIVSVACFPGAETTDMATRETMIQEVSSLGRILFRVCRDTRLQVYDGLALVMRTLAEGGSKAAEPMRYAALQEGAILTHLRESLMVVNAEVESEALSSRELVSLWCDGFGPAMDLIRRIFPPGLTMFLDKGVVRKRRPSQEQVMNSNDPSSNNMADVYVAGRGHQSAYSFLQGDWNSFWEHVDLDCHHAGLIWNETCRSELRQCLKNEENLLHVGQQKLMESLEQNPSWNYGDFRVQYKSLMHQMQVGGIYVKLLVESNGDATVLEHIRNPKEFVSSAYMYFLTAKEECSGLQDGDMALERQYICIEAIAIVYKRYCGLVGPFAESQIRHVLRMCDASSDRKLRFLCLKLLHALINPDHVSEDDMIRKIAKENAIQSAHHGGISLFCDAVATIHQVSSSYASSTKDTKLIAAGSFNVQQPKLWYYADSMESIAGSDRDEVYAQFEKVKKGPVTKKEIRMHYRNGLINNGTFVHRIGMKYATPLSSIRELRWWCDHGSSPYPERDFALMALDSLICIFELCPARDVKSGIQLLPVPMCHRNFSPKSSISRVVQAILTNDPDFVNKACKLLRLFVEQNASEIKTIYQTGVFYYILAYSGSDLVEPAKFLKCTHLQQKFIPSDGGFGDALSQRSILGDFLPESLLFILESYGPEAFSTAITGDSETPEIIWTHLMRGQKLIPHLWNHIGDFASLLKESWAVTYDYYPCPPVIYDEIAGEIWCHRYYLRHLCNTLAYPNWKIVDHVEFLQSVLCAWKTEISKVGVKSMSTEEAALLLELEPSSNITESDMKKAYRRLAKKYHPDRNPAGRDQFEAIHEAYMRLHSAKEEVSGPRDWCILLYIQAQCLLYKSHSDILKDYKYAGYPYLIASLSLANTGDQEDFGQILSESFLPLLSATFELCWLTCEASELNAEELMRSGGTDILEKIFSRCVSIAPSDIPSTSPLAVVMTNILKTLATMASFESAQCELEGKVQLLKDAIKCVNLERAYNVISASLKFLSAISGSQAARADLIMYKTPIPLVSRLFGYDCTLVETGLVEENLEYEFLGTGNNASTHAQQDLHDIAILSCALLDKLLGTQIMTDSIPISSGQFALQAMFTPAISRYIHEHGKFLEAINGARDDHLVIWNEPMKKHLLETMHNVQTLDPTEYLHSITEIRYESLIGETFISGVYVKNFCKIPSKDGVDDVEFCKSLVKALHSLQQMDESSYDDGTNLLKNQECRLEKPGNIIERKKGESHTEMLGRTLVSCLEALQKILGLSPKLLGLLSTVGSIEPISSLLMWNVQYGRCVSGCPLEAPDMLKATDLAISVLSTLCSNAKCLAAISAPNTPLMLSLLIDSPPSDSILAGACECLIHLAEQAEFAKFCSDAGGIFYLLNFVIQDTPSAEEEKSKSLQTLKLKCLQAIVKASSNPVHGMKCVIILERLFPKGILSRLLNDDAETSYDIIHSTSKNPEIIWNKETLSHLRAELSIICDAARREQIAKIDGVSRNQKIEWYIRQDFKVKYACLDSHTEIDGVYIDLLLENPGYPLRNPQSLLDSTVKAFLHSSSVSKDSDMLVSVVTMLVSSHPTLADHGVSAGFLTSLVQVLEDMLKDAIPIQKSPRAMSCMKLIHTLSSSNLSSESLVRVEPPVLHVLMEALHGEPQMKLMALEVIKRALGIHQSGRDIIIRSALDFNLLPRLFELLEWRSDEGDSENQSVNAMIQFLCIEIIRSMEQDGPYKASIKTILENSDIWSAYKSQKHDLFLPSGAQQASSLLRLAQGPQQSYLLTGVDQQAEDEHAIGDDLIEKAMAQDD